ncbi:MAG: zinc ribbon domain-containing protein [Anaerolineales bacterium]|nr:zinc ribbon domain-containing protein [Anaerolineales bacterium]
MRKWILILILGIFLAFPSSAFAQTSITLTSMNVQLWPEFDQPSVLVITDFTAAASTKFPVDMSFRIPLDANLIAVATYTADGSLMNAVFEGPTVQGEWQVFTVTLEAASARFEYYQPITFSGNQRVFSYLWNGDYAVSAFNMRVLEPADTTSLTTVPKLSSISQTDGLKYFEGKPVKLKSGEQYALNLQYTKTTDTLIKSSQTVQPSAPVDENTPGRVSLNNYLPYIIGGVGVLLIVGGFVYYLRSGRNSSKRARRRAHTINVENEEADEELYCPQCGTRAKSNDRFCRVCGARIRRQEE